MFQAFEYVTVFPSQQPYHGEPSEGLSGQYVLKDHYQGSTLLDGFNFETASDPTHGHVLYQSRQAAESLNLTYYGNDDLTYIHADHKERAPHGRKSVRLSTKKQYTKGIFVLDVAHMPTGCGVWPAFWSTAVSSWPNKGEIDILEGVNLDTDNAFTLHTGPGCRMAKYRKQKGNTESMDCNVNAVDQWPNQGCGVKTPDSFGAKFNEQGGKVVVMQWERNLIRTWLFDHQAVPFDILVNAPQPDLDISHWDLPDATFDSAECDIDKIFADHVFIINVSSDYSVTSIC